MTALFNFYGTQKKLSEMATDAVRLYRLEREKKLENSKNFLIGTSSPIRIQILDAASKGELSICVDFKELNKNNKLGNCDFEFTDKEINLLIIDVMSYLELEGFNYSAVALNESTQLNIHWPDPSDFPENQL